MGAEANRAELVVAPETTFGVQATTGTQDMRFTGESLTSERSVKPSDELDAGRNLRGQVQTKQEANGGIEFEFSFGTYDLFVEAALFNSWVSYTHTSTSSVSVGGVYTLSAAERNKLKVGQALIISGFASADNNGIKVITEITSTGIKVGVAGGSAETDATATFKGSSVINGVARKSFSIEKRFTDIQKYQLFVGMVLNELSFSLETESVISGSVSFVGLSVEHSDNIYFSSGVTAKTDSEMMSCSAGVGIISVDGVSIGYASSLSLGISNNLSSKTALFDADLYDIGEGSCDVTGSLSLYFPDTSLLDKYAADAAFTLTFAMLDNAGDRGYVVTLPSVKFSNFNANAASKGEDVKQETEFTALYDKALDGTIIISKVE